MIIVMGVPGAGKSSVLSGAAGSGYIFVNYGDLMFEIAKVKFSLQNRDEMRKLDVKKQSEVQKAVAEKLAGMKGKIILDTHCSIATPSGYLPGLPFALLGKLKVEKLVYITAPPNEILARRQKDATRKRESSIEQLQDHEGINRAFLAAYSAFTGSPAAIIYNRDGALESAVADFKKLL